MNAELRLDPARAKELIEELSRRLIAKGIDGTIRIIGGTAMALRFPHEPELRVTSDIDALYTPRPEIDEEIGAMAREHGLPENWMNDAGAPWGAVEDTGDPIVIATPHELVAMKMAAGRPQDIVDLRILARHLGVTDPNTLVDIAYAIYGLESVALVDSRESYELFARDVLR